MSKQGPCPTVIRIVGRPGTGSLPSTIAPPDHPPLYWITSRMNIAPCCPEFMLLVFQYRVHIPTEGWSGGAMVLGKLPVPLDIFTLIYPFFPLSPSLWETARYRLKYCLEEPLNPKPTYQASYTHGLVFILLVFQYRVHIPTV